MSPVLARALRGAVLALPLIGLGWTWLSTDQMSRQGSEWDVPVQGYDPVDYFKGHYVRFTYDWPKTAKTGEDTASYDADTLCLEGTPPHLDRVTYVRTDANAGDRRQPCAYPVRATESRFRGFSMLNTGRLYASEARAMDLQRQLADPKLQGMVRVRLRPDGSLMPLGITFRPRVPEVER